MFVGGHSTLSLAIFLVVIGFNDIANDRTGRLTTVLAAFLNKNRDDDFRIALGGITDEPGVIFKLFLFAEAVAGVVADDLCSAGFSAEFDAGELELAAGAARFVHHAIHTVGDFFDGVFGKGEFLFGDILGVFEHVRLLENSSGGNASDKMGELYGSGGDGALADGDGYGLTGIPFAVEDALDPLFGRHEASFFRRKIDARFVTDAQFIAVVGEAIDAKFHADGIEKDVAGFQDGFVQVSDTVRRRALLGGINPTLELAAVERAVARAIGGEAFRDAMVFEHGGGGDNFVDGTGCELGLNSAVQERVQRILVELAPFFLRNADSEIIGIGSRAADHCQDIAGAGVKSDDSARAHAERLFGDLLEIEIDGERDLFAGNRILLGKVIDFLADAVDDHAAHAVGAHQDFVVLALEAGFADDVAGT